MKITEKKEFVLEYIELAEKFIEGNFKTIEMFVDRTVRNSVSV